MTGSVGSTPVADVLSAWIAPLILFVVVLVACWLGLRWLRAEHLQELRSVPLFSGLSDHELLWVLRSTRQESFAPGIVMIHEGETGGDFYLITEGRAKVTVDGAEVATLGPGSYAGEMALLDGGARTATVTASEPVTTLALGRTAFLRTVDREPMLARGLYAELTRRLKEGGVSVDWDGTSRVDQAMLVDACGRLRSLAEPGWASATAPPKRRLVLTRLFARGS